VVEADVRARAIDAEDYRSSVAPWTNEILTDVGVPMIHFGVGTGHVLGEMRRAGGDVIGVDWRTPLDTAWDAVGSGVGVQGNLDPAVCLAPWGVVRRKALEVIRRAGGRDGHVFNLGHGVLPTTRVATLQRLVDLVHEETAR
jgi:uroporphyrinogen decarboxylase